MARRLQRTLGCVLLVGVVSSCTGASPSVPAEIRPVADAEQDELVALFTAADVDEDIYRFGVSDAAPLPDGTVVVSYDLAAESAGDETPRQQRLVILGDGGALEPIALPTLGSARVGTDASLLTTAPDGTIYLWDRDPERVLARDPAGQWRVLPVELVLTSRYAPLAAVGPDGALYLCDDDAVQRLDADGTLTRVVGVYTPNAGEGQPPLPVDQLPLPASSVRLPYPFSLAVGDDGVVFVSNRDQVLAVDNVGTVSLAAEISTIWEDIGRPDVDADGKPSVPGALGIDSDGALLVSFFYEQLVVRVVESGAAVLARGAALASDGLNASYSPGGDLLVLLLADSSGEVPPRLGALGR